MNLQQLSTVAEILGLLFVAIAMVVVTVRMPHSTAYRCAVGLALAAVLILFWVHGAVGIIGDSDDVANLMYVGVLAVGIVGAVVARFEPAGMALALFAMAFAQALVAVITLLAALDPPAMPLIMMLNGMCIVFYVGSAMLFRRAAEARSQPDAVHEN